jgi:hypothetical protein
MTAAIDNCQSSHARSHGKIGAADCWARTPKVRIAEQEARVMNSASFDHLMATEEKRVKYRISFSSHGDAALQCVDVRGVDCGPWPCDNALEGVSAGRDR